MRATEIIRNLLDIIDAVDKPPIEAQISISKPMEDPMNQIADLIDDQDSDYSNSPKEQYAGVDSVTTNAGGGLNGPKDPRDLRGNSVRIYGDN
jgi:hypothetical protein